MILKRIAIVLAAFALSACNMGEPVQGAPKPGDVIDIPAFEWHVTDVPGLQSAYQNGGGSLGERSEALGFTATRERDGATLVYTTVPKRVDDLVACTLGHEVMHIALGNYHKDYKSP